MGKHRDWTEIEKDYRENGLSYPKLAEKYQVPLPTLKKAAARQGWVKSREHSQAIANGTDENGTGTSSDEMVPNEVVPVFQVLPKDVRPAESDKERFDRMVSAMMDRVEDGICQMDVTNVGAIKLMTAALRDLRKLKHLDKTPLDIEEQKARINKLKSEAAIREINTEPVVVQFINMDGAEE